MIELFSLLNGLHQEEIKTIRGSFKKVNADAESLFMAELFSIILSSNGKFIQDKELSVMVYGQEKLLAIAKLKSRLFQFILEVLSSDAVLSKEQLFDHSDYQVIRIRKKIVQFRVLYRKKYKVETSVMYHLLSEIIKEAKEYEQYDVLVEALYFKKTMMIIRKGFSEIAAIEKQIDQYHYAYKALLKANSYYFELVVSQDLTHRAKTKSDQVDHAKEFLKEAIQEMEGYIIETNSVSIRYIQKLFQLDELLRSNMHDSGIDVCLDILNILKKQKHLYRSERVGFVYDNISLCHVYKGNVDDSIVSARKAQEYYSPGSFNFMISKEQEFFACFYGSSYNKAHSIITELLKFPIMNVGEFRHDKYLFFEAATLFKLGDQRKALIISNQALEINKDKSRWDLGIRYLRLMCMVELMDYDQAYAAIEALRKTMSRNNKQMAYRDEIVYRAFNEFASTGFSASPTNRLVELLQDLSSQESLNAWNYYTHEVIPVHKWIESKITTKKNAPSYVVI
ncbi:MAG: hypothetical protein JWP12_1832 [Bacteroidetes bacterium]|nr:hypothetical protein [Bacteroidota bacterium]